MQKKMYDSIFSVQSILFVLIFHALYLQTSIAQVDTLFYHDFQFESQVGITGGTPDDGQLLTRFTPNNYPVLLEGAGIFFRNAGSAATYKLVVFLDSTGSANGPAFSDKVFHSTNPKNNPGAGGVKDSAYYSWFGMSTNNIIVGKGDIYVGVSQYSTGATGYLGLSRDTMPVITTYDDRQWASLDKGFSWNKLIFHGLGGQYGISAFFSIWTDKKEDITNPVFSLEIIQNENSGPMIARYSLPKQAGVSLRIYDLNGRLMSTLLDNQELQEGVHLAYLSGLPFAKGIYLIKLEVENNGISKKIIIY